MAGFVKGIDRSQTVLFPDRLDDWVAEDSMVRVGRRVDGAPCLGEVSVQPRREAAL